MKHTYILELPDGSTQSLKVGYVDREVKGAEIEHRICVYSSGSREPVLFVSEGQLLAHTDPECEIAGRYLPARITPSGKFTVPLYLSKY